VLLLDKTLRDRELTGQTHDAQTGWLDEQERRHDYLIYAGDPDASPWTARCVRQADRILVVANADTGPSHDVVAARMVSLGLPRDGTRTELVLLQPADRTTPGTPTPGCRRRRSTVTITSAAGGTRT